MKIFKNLQGALLQLENLFSKFIELYQRHPLLIVTYYRSFKAPKQFLIFLKSLKSKFGVIPCFANILTLDYDSTIISICFKNPNNCQFKPFICFHLQDYASSNSGLKLLARIF